MYVMYSVTYNCSIQLVIHACTSIPIDYTYALYLLIHSLNCRLVTQSSMSCLTATDTTATAVVVAATVYIYCPCGV